MWSRASLRRGSGVAIDAVDNVERSAILATEGNGEGDFL
jgi:hypothetical protein